MKFLTYADGAHTRIGLLHEGRVLPLFRAAEAEKVTIPALLEDYIKENADFDKAVRQINQKFISGAYGEWALDYNALTVLAPISLPTSCRDGYAFRQHVAAARRNRNVEMIAEFDHYPIFYFTNHNAIIGPGDVLVMADHLQKLDFELEAAVVLGKRGRNIRAKDADEYIFGYTIMNDWSARTLQMDEMKLNLGPAKGKDFATAIGPVLVTRDELTDFLTPAKENHVGERHNLTMTAKVNGVEVSRGNLADMDWTFAEIIERCAYGSDIYPTDVIGSGTVGTGCFLELNGTALRLDPNAKPQWLQPNDVVELAIDQLGVLTNRVVKENDFSIIKEYKLL